MANQTTPGSNSQNELPLNLNNTNQAGRGRANSIGRGNIRHTYSNLPLRNRIQNPQNEPVLYGNHSNTDRSIADTRPLIADTPSNQSADSILNSMVSNTGNCEQDNLTEFHSQTQNFENDDNDETFDFKNDDDYPLDSI